MKAQTFKLGDMEVGLVPLSQITTRRDNYRKMSSLQMQALRKSIDRFGFKTLVAVERTKTGFAIIDGHHRVDVLREKGAESVPVVILEPNHSKDELDLAMVTFNITGDVMPDKFYDLITELEASLGLEEVAEATAVSVDFLSELRRAEAAAHESAEDIPEMVTEQSTKKGKGKKRLIAFMGQGMRDGSMWLVEVPGDLVPTKETYTAAGDLGFALIVSPTPEQLDTNEDIIAYMEKLVKPNADN